MTIALTPKQRIALETILAAQEGKANDLRIWFSILEKIETSMEYRSRYMRQIGNSVFWEDGAIALADPTHVDFETEECHRMIALFDSWPRFTTADMKWVLPLRQALSDAVNNPGKKHTN